MTARVDVRWSAPEPDRVHGDWLDDVEARRLHRLAPGPQRRAFVTSRVLLKTLVGELAAVPPTTVRLGYTCPVCGDPHGRPVVLAPHDATSVQVSLAHAGDRVVVAATTAAPVGVDVEPQPAAAVRGLAPVDVVDWCGREAVFKAGGAPGAADPMAVRLDRVRCHPTDLDVGPGYAGAVCLLTDHPVVGTVRPVSARAAATAGPARAARPATAR